MTTATQLAQIWISEQIQIGMELEAREVEYSVLNSFNPALGGLQSTYCAEGLVQSNVEIDLYWTPKPLKDCR